MSEGEDIAAREFRAFLLPVVVVNRRERRPLLRALQFFSSEPIEDERPDRFKKGWVDAY